MTALMCITSRRWAKPNPPAPGAWLSRPLTVAIAHQIGRCFASGAFRRKLEPVQMYPSIVALAESVCAELFLKAAPTSS